MKNLIVILTSIILMTSVAGCSDKDSATPESVARALLASLQDGDSERYKNQCSSREDLSEYVEAVISSGELEGSRLERYKKLRTQVDDWYTHLSAEQMELFDWLVEQKKWAEIEVTEIESKPYMKDGVENFGVTMELSDGSEIRCYQIIKTSNGYKIFEDAPVKLQD